ncbi:hypothetical protein [Kineosporia succinea]|uniref:FtsX-like permease family protein n=1 Tax=Kineosporia succinea TaxID=84632 RepID=A0ABT9P8M7_9ACTN|nr:hypothetical protein [Kineosporia succinea]MDP9829044.1 hypothetical protein [Kineosporia succinea]
MRVGWPLLRRAPGRLLRSGSLALMLTISVALLAGLVAAGPLFGRATANGSLERKLATVPHNTQANQQAALTLILPGRLWDDTRVAVTKMLDDVPWLDPVVTSVWSGSWENDIYQPMPFLGVGDRRKVAVLYHRTGAVEALDVVRGRRGAKGLWLPDGLATELGLEPGDSFRAGKTLDDGPTLASCNGPGSGGGSLGLEPGTPTTVASTVTLAGTYRTAPDGRVPTGRYFSALAARLPGDPSRCPLTALLMIGDEETVQGALKAADEIPDWTYSADLSQDGRSLDRLEQAATRAQELRLGPGDLTSDLWKAVAGQGVEPRVESGLPALYAEAEADARTAAQQGRGIALAGAALGLAAVVIALRALAQRRRRENELLVGLGTPLRAVVATSALELLLPAVIGALAGAFAAYLAFAFLGPQSRLGADAIVTTLGAAALVALVTLAGNAVVTVLQARSIGRRLAGREPLRSPGGAGGFWLPLLLGAAVLAVGSVLARDGRASYTDPLSAVLPILVLAGGSLLLVRLAAFGTRLRRRPTGTGGAGVDRLVLRGLRDTGVAVTDLVVVLAIGVGVLAYGLVSADVVHASVHDKTAVLAGATSAAHVPNSPDLGGGEGPAPGLGDGLAVVWRARAQLQPDYTDVDILVVNPETLPAVALWGVGPELAQARQALRKFDEPVRGVLPALLVGIPGREPGRGGTVSVGAQELQLIAKADLTAFPGATRPTVVLDARSLFTRLDILGKRQNPSIAGNIGGQGTYATWLWSSRPAAALETYLDGKHITPLALTSIEQARATPVLTSSGWAATYQIVLGLAALALAGLSVVVAVDRRVARAAPVDLVLRRFGVRPARLVRLRAGELALTGLAALAVLVLPFGVVMTLLPRLVEPGPTLSPAMDVSVPLVPLLLSVLAAAAVTAAAVWVAARRSATLKPAEVLRDDA